LRNLGQQGRVGGGQKEGSRSSLLLLYLSLILTRIYRLLRSPHPTSHSTPTKTCPNARLGHELYLIASSLDIDTYL
jgi:hypothetical protein